LRQGAWRAAAQRRSGGARDDRIGDAAYARAARPRRHAAKSPGAHCRVHARRDLRTPARAGQAVTLVIRRYEDRDRAAVRDLFVRVNRALAPEAMRDQFEGYIARSLAEEIDLIPAYYAARQGGFWVAHEGEQL